MGLVIATSNQHKLKEFKALLQGFPLTILSLKDFTDIPAIVEDGKNFYENALKKALTVASHTDKLTIADDSGIEVDALDGKPGVYSARFAGEDATDEANNTKLLKELKDVPSSKRGACFKCVLVIAPSDGETTFVEGACRGTIIHEARGGYGFGYDPLFLVPEYNKTFSEITPEEKNKISHRARALQELLKIVPQYLHR